jgi:enamine deaminase RidA (YjgF/YER057c/UK114 family)
MPQRRAERQKLNPTDSLWRKHHMAIERFDIGPRMSQMVVFNGIAFLAGQVAVDAPGASVTEQTQNILGRIDQLLERIGSDRKKILSATIWLADMSTFQEMNAVWDAWVPEGHTPARATVEAKLAGPQFTIEIAVVAAAGGDGS